jgi:hypothetical protein
MGREESQHTDKIIGLTEQVLDAKNHPSIPHGFFKSLDFLRMQYRQCNVIMIFILSFLYLFFFLFHS